MGRPKKQQDLEKQVEQEVGLTGSSETTTAVADISKEKSLPNELNDEYSIKVKMDYDSSADICRVPDPDPRYEYRWLRDDVLNMGIKRSNLFKNKGGWDLVTKAHALRIGFTNNEIGADGLCRRNELILAFMPKELYAIKRADEKERTTSRMDKVINLGMTGDASAKILPGQMDGGRVSFGKKSKKEVTFTTREE